VPPASVRLTANVESFTSVAPMPKACVRNVSGRNADIDPTLTVVPSALKCGPAIVTSRPPSLGATKPPTALAIAK